MIRLKIVTPEAAIYDGEVASVTLPGSEGEFAVMPGHAPLMAQIVPGELRYATQSATESLAVGEGFAEVSGTFVNVMTDLAVPEAEIDEAKVQEAITRAQQALKEQTLAGDELEMLEAGLSRSIAQLRLKRKKS